MSYAFSVHFVESSFEQMNRALHVWRLTSMWPKQDFIHESATSHHHCVLWRDRSLKTSSKKPILQKQPNMSHNDDSEGRKFKTLANTQFQSEQMTVTTCRRLGFTMIQFMSNISAGLRWTQWNNSHRAELWRGFLRCLFRLSSVGVRVPFIGHAWNRKITTLIHLRRHWWYYAYLWCITSSWTPSAHESYKHFPFVVVVIISCGKCGILR